MTDKIKKPKIEKYVRIMRDIQLSSSPGERTEDMNRRIVQVILANYEKRWPSEDRLAGIIRDYAIKNKCYWNTTDHLVNTPIQGLATEISKRIGGAS